MFFSLYSPVAISFFLILHCYVLWKLLPCIAKKWRMIGSLIYFVLSAIFLTFPLLLRYGLLAGGSRQVEIMFALSITEFVLVSMLCSAIVFTDVLRICLGLWDRWRKTDLEPRITLRKASVFSLAAVACVVIYGCFEAWNVRRVDILIPTEKLPPGVSHLRIVQVSDVHLGGVYYTSHLERIMKIVREAEPDIFVVTGDLVDGNMRHRLRESELVAAHGAKYGAFAVTGNHEYYYNIDEAVEFIAKSGLTLLDDSFAEAGGIVIVGLDDNTEIWPPKLDVPKDRFVLLLKHHPQIPKFGAGKFDLQLCGHTHGGQIWLCNLAMKRAYNMTQGMSKHGGSLVYVSNGAGFWGPPLRLLAPPEVTVFDLVNVNAVSSAPQKYRVQKMRVLTYT
ncbi:MAG: metallophosphoesterase [Synergistaceae bacterium]|jgi:predicted MPP superfamily phosphohydrolase|nr:metallophosphoesterase [Synergistaceae bacterium]